MTCIYIFAFGEYNFKQVNVSGIKIFRAQLLALNLRKVMLNTANIYLFGFILTKCKYIYRYFFYLLKIKEGGGGNQLKLRRFKGGRKKHKWPYISPEMHEYVSILGSRIPWFLQDC